MIRPKLIIFDCDGVLVDSEGPTTRILARYFSGHGLAITPHEVADLFVGGTMKSAGELAQERGARLPEGWFEDLTGQVIARMGAGVPLIPGVLDLINRAEDAGIATAIASNGAMAKMEASLGPSGLYQRFEGRIFSGYVHGQAKPAPDLVLAALAQAGVSAEEAAMIDDSPSGCRAAIATGVRCIGYAAEGQGPALAALGAEVATDMSTAAALLTLD